MRFILRAHAPVSRDLSYNLNFDIPLRTHIFKKIEYRINKVNRASSNYNEFNIE